MFTFSSLCYFIQLHIVAPLYAFLSDFIEKLIGYFYFPCDNLIVWKNPLHKDCVLFKDNFVCIFSFHEICGNEVIKISISIKSGLAKNVVVKMASFVHII